MEPQMHADAPCGRNDCGPGDVTCQISTSGRNVREAFRGFRGHWAR